jgi:hypothetical protein
VVFGRNPRLFVLTAFERHVKSCLILSFSLKQRIDLGALNTEWQSRVERIRKLVETVPGVTTDITIPQDENSYPTLTVTWDEKKFGLNVAECDQQLRAGEPRIEVLTNSNPSGVLCRIHDPNRPRRERPNHLQIISMTMQPGEDLIVGNRLRQVLDKARKQSV